LIEIKSNEITELLNKFKMIEKEKQENTLLKEKIESLEKEKQENKLLEEKIENLEKDKKKIQTEYNNLLTTLETYQKEKENPHLENIEEHSNESKFNSYSSSKSHEKEAKTLSKDKAEKEKIKSATDIEVFPEEKVPKENISPKKRNSHVLKKIEIDESAPRLSEKRLSLKARLHGLIFENKKIFTLKTPEGEGEKIVEKKEPVPVYVPPKSEVIHVNI
jgi:hypothetical protein